MIVKNEEDTLERCLTSVDDLMDEIIIVDTGSTDKTIEVANKFKCKVFNFKWIDDFSAARNFAFSKASMDYILWLDADDVLLLEDRQKFKTLKKNIDNSVDSYSMIYNYGFDKHGNITFNFRRNRLVKRENNFLWNGVVHEYIDISGKVVDTDICITHKRIHDSGERNLQIYKTLIEKGQKLNTRDKYYYAQELFDHKFYNDAILNFKDFLTENDSWIEDRISACRKVSLCYYYLNQLQKCREFCFKTFEFNLPRAEECCRLGLTFLDQEKIEEAIFWYKIATQLKKPKNCWGYINDADWTWRPHLQLCICYYKIGDYDKAFKHNEIATKYNPEHKSIIYNSKFFKKLGYEIKT